MTTWWSACPDGCYYWQFGRSCCRRRLLPDCPRGCAAGQLLLLPV
jgi:hypothetical protein